MNYQNLHNLFKLTPKIRAVVKEHSEEHRQERIIALLNEEFPDFDVVLGEAFSAYSSQGFLAFPHPKTVNSYTRGFFDWGVVDFVKRTHVTPTNHLFMQVPCSLFFIQYLITGGYKNKLIGMDANALNDEMQEAKLFLKSMLD